MASSWSGWILWVWLVGVVVRRYINFLVLLIAICSSCICFFGSSIATFCSLYKFCIFYNY